MESIICWLGFGMPDGDRLSRPSRCLASSRVELMEDHDMLIEGQSINASPRDMVFGEVERNHARLSRSRNNFRLRLQE